MKPYKEKKLEDGSTLRVFRESVKSQRLVWHRDRQNRVVEVICGNGWKFQRDGSVPIQIGPGSLFEVNANEWHRIIKGKDDLIVKITESKKSAVVKKRKKYPEKKK
tara:strand:- start:197 stop:514 length:318 start_codon:yes stop_codon:yes gene_type:complete